MRTLEIEKTIFTIPQLIDNPLPQLALAGRSNVGKSSLINSLANRKKLAKTSGTPGKTRSLNFYKVMPDDFFLVDLPGYGYAKCSKSERKKFSELIDYYLKNTRTLSAVAVLIDIRLPPQKSDLELANYLVSLGIPFFPVFTKADKCSQKERSYRQSEWKSLFQLAKLPVCTSSSTRMGMENLWEEILFYVK